MAAARRAGALAGLALLAAPALAQTDIGGSVVVTQLRESKEGYATYTVSLAAGREIADVYALFGERGDPLVVPPAFQVPAPFGQDVGVPDQAFVAFNPDTQFDSFLTIGIDGPALQSGALSSIGLEFGGWSEIEGLSSEDGVGLNDFTAPRCAPCSSSDLTVRRRAQAVFFMDPVHGATGSQVVLMQLTVRAGTRFAGSLSCQGKAADGGDDWVAAALRFNQDGGVGKGPGEGHGSNCPPPGEVRNGAWQVGDGGMTAVLVCEDGLVPTDGPNRECRNGRLGLLTVCRDSDSTVSANRGGSGRNGLRASQRRLSWADDMVGRQRRLRAALLKLNRELLRLHGAGAAAASPARAARFRLHGQEVPRLQPSCQHGRWVLRPQWRPGPTLLRAVRGLLRAATAGEPGGNGQCGRCPSSDHPATRERFWLRHVQGRCLLR